MTVYLDSAPATLYLQQDAGERLLIDRFMPVYDLAITEHVVVGSDATAVYSAAAGFDFMTVRTPLLMASMFVRGLPARIRGTTMPAPPHLRLIDETDGIALPGWLLLGRDDREIAFGAVGKFWNPDSEWRDVPVDGFTSCDVPGWGKIACHFLVRRAGPERSTLTYECRVATTDDDARQRMGRYWWLIRPFVGHILRATLRTIADTAGTTT